MTATFKAYVGDPDFHDGNISHLRQESGDLSVEIVGFSGARCLVRFNGVESVMSHNPEGMVLYALSEMDAQLPLRKFCFANSKEPDQHGGNSRLEIVARSFSVERL